MVIRHATSLDDVRITNLHHEAFGASEGPLIADLVAHLHDDATASPLISLVATDDKTDTVVGHVLFTAVHISTHAVPAHILAPLAVAPAHHRQGIGSRLVREGLAQVKAQGSALVFVLGNPAYYRRFGFLSATAHGFMTPHPIPEHHADAWMVQAFTDGVLGTVHGTVHCAQALTNPQYW